MTSLTPTRTVLITGTSSGIGLETAIAAARAGWSVVATLRDPARATALRDAASAAAVDLDIRTLDVTDSTAVATTIADVVAAHGALDAVVNNAGAAAVGTLESLSLDDFRAAMEVNFFGVVAVSKAAMPHLRASGGRLLTISSVGGAVGQPFNEAYCAAKFAVEGFMQSLHPVAASVGVSVGVIEPAAVASAFIDNAAIDIPAAIAAAGPYAPALSAYLARTATSFSNAQASSAVAAVIVEALDAPSVPPRQQTSPAASAFVALSLADLDGSRVTGMTAGWVGSDA